MFRVLFYIKPKQFSRLIFNRDLEKLAKTIVGILVVAIFFTGIYWVLHRVFSYLYGVQDIGIILIDRLIGIGFIAFFMMLIISNLITAIGTLYRSEEATFLIASPLKHSDVFWIKFVDNLFYSSWATLIVGLPLVVAYGVVHSFSITNYFIVALLVIPPFLLIPATLGTAISLFLFPLAKKYGIKRIAMVFIGLSLIALYFLLRARFSKIFFSAQGDLALLNYYLRDLAKTDMPFLPSAWILEVFKSARTGDSGEMWFYISTLISTAGMTIVVLDIFAERLYYKAYLAANQILSKKKKADDKIRTLYGKTWKLFSVFPRDMRSLFVKDAKLFFRDPNQWSHFTILLVLIIVYLINLRHAPMDIESLYWRTMISFVNYAFSGYILATLAVRFVYPSISMEGHSFWSIASSGLSIKRLFWEKFLIAFFIFFILAELVAVISNAILVQGPAMMLLNAVGIFLTSISLTALATGLGIIFPSFEEQNPGKIASSGGGMICALITLIFVALSTLALAFPTYHYMRFITGERSTFPTIEVIIGAFILVAINTAATFIPLRLGLKAIYKAEF